MKKIKDKQPNIYVELTPKGLKPQTQYDMERLAAEPQGRVYQLEPISKRSDKQLRTFWKALGLVVKSTGRWPSPEHLCRDLKFTLGFRQMVTDLKTGEVHENVDSIALNNMDPDMFRRFMDQSMELIASKVGFDPMSFLTEE